MVTDYSIGIPKINLKDMDGNNRPNNMAQKFSFEIVFIPYVVMRFIFGGITHMALNGWILVLIFLPILNILIYTKSDKLTYNIIVIALMFFVLILTALANENQMIVKYSSLSAWSKVKHIASLFIYVVINIYILSILIG